LIILDDLMDETDQRMASLFTEKSHHRNIIVMYIVQNLFHRGKHMSDIVYESPDKDGFFTSGWSRDHTGKWMDPRHEMIWTVFIGNVKCVK
jgi:hypothetical protein